MNPLEIFEPSSTGMVFFHLKLQPVILFLIQVSTHWHGHVHRDHDVSCKGHKLLDPKWPHKESSHPSWYIHCHPNWGSVVLQPLKTMWKKHRFTSEGVKGSTKGFLSKCIVNSSSPKLNKLRIRIMICPEYLECADGETWIGSSTSFQKSMNGRKALTSKLQLDVDASEGPICNQW